MTARTSVAWCPDGHGEIYRGPRAAHAADRHEQQGDHAK